MFQESDFVAGWLTTLLASQLLFLTKYLVQQMAGHDPNPNCPSPQPVPPLFNDVLWFPSIHWDYFKLKFLMNTNTWADVTHGLAMLGLVHGGPHLMGRPIEMNGYPATFLTLGMLITFGLQNGVDRARFKTISHKISELQEDV